MDNIMELKRLLRIVLSMFMFVKELCLVMFHAVLALVRRYFAFLFSFLRKVIRWPSIFDSVVNFIELRGGGGGFAISDLLRSEVWLVGISVLTKLII